MKNTVSIFGIAVLMGAVAMGQTSSTAARKSSKSKKSSDVTAATQTGSSASGTATDSSTQSVTGSTGAQSSETSSSNQVKAGNSGFDDTTSANTSVSPSTGQSGTETPSAYASNSGSSQAGASSPTASSDQKGYSQSTSADMDSISNGPVAETVGDTNVLIGWATRSNASNTGIKYGTDRSRLSETAQGTDGTDGKNHHARLQGLQPNTRYYFQVTANGSPVGGIGTFKTTAAGEAPVQSKAVIPQK
jgi:hypothetical protein